MIILIALLNQECSVPSNGELRERG
jgi:hypothetical protein